jgi:hypothetical protein
VLLSRQCSSLVRPPASQSVICSIAVASSEPAPKVFRAAGEHVAVQVEDLVLGSSSSYIGGDCDLDIREARVFEDPS